MLLILLFKTSAVAHPNYWKIVSNCELWSILTAYVFYLRKCILQFKTMHEIFDLLCGKFYLYDIQMKKLLSIYSQKFTKIAAFDDGTFNNYWNWLIRRNKWHLEEFVFKLLKLNHSNIFSVVISRLFLTSLRVGSHS